MLKFTKMHGLGNDYVYMDAINQNIENRNELAKFVSDRHFGIGSDGLILICPSERADFKMQMFNSDGTEAEMCGNGIRCVGKFVYDKGLTNKETIKIETLAGIKILELNIENNIIFKGFVIPAEGAVIPILLCSFKNVGYFMLSPSSLYHNKKKRTMSFSRVVKCCRISKVCVML